MKKHYTVRNWKEMKKLVSNTNHYNDTLILCGFVKKLKKNKNNIEFETSKLIFKKVSVEHLKE